MYCLVILCKVEKITSPRSRYDCKPISVCSHIMTWDFAIRRTCTRTINFLLLLLTFLLRYLNDLKTTSKGLVKFGRVSNTCNNELSSNDIPNEISNDQLTNNDRDKKRHLLKFTIINVRSLNNKSCSLIDSFDNLSTAFSIITETWFKAGPVHDELVSNLATGHNLQMIERNRPKKESQQNPGGGVCIVFKRA